MIKLFILLVTVLTFQVMANSTVGNTSACSIGKIKDFTKFSKAVNDLGSDLDNKKELLSCAAFYCNAKAITFLLESESYKEIVNTIITKRFTSRFGVKTSYRGSVLSYALISDCPYSKTAKTTMVEKILEAGADVLLPVHIHSVSRRSGTIIDVDYNSSIEYAEELASNSRRIIRKEVLDLILNN